MKTVFLLFVLASLYAMYAALNLGAYLILLALLWPVAAGVITEQRKQRKQSHEN